MKEIELAIEGMSCRSCVTKITGAVAALPGVATVDVSLDEARARVGIDEGQVTPAAVEGAIRDAGFAARLRA